ncbi:T7SS effector LXG polymorphic toxin [Agathobacter rectalis]|uniref:NAD+--asparagine ADP-ribosyltransferase n=6 Tax=Agathobacter rectalis TaxID=39491 RepID=A0A173VUL6_9FIRM|nr:T7SS effector LXG polymorphic toxin [Agathobacter rectalis]CUN30450.1 NAD+--asparagine ADP-ribosyltransferase [Agathobacter rectalis]
MEGFQINYTDLSDLFWEYKRKIENLIENIDNCIERINMFTENAVFTGKTGDAVKSYLGEAHITILSGIKVTAQTLLDNMAAYKDGYRAIDSSTNFKLDEEAIQEFRKKLASNYEDTDEYTGKIRSALSEVSDISDVGMPDSNGVFDIHEQMDSDLIKLVSNVNSYERENVVRLENSVELLLENLQSCLSKIGLSQCAIESYETGSFITGKDAGALNTGIKIFGDLHEKNKEAYDEIYETEQKIKDEAEKRKTQGIWRMVGGAVLIATGAACIVLTGGAAIPIVADVAVAVGSGTAVFGAADAIEGTQDIYYGSTGDIDSTAVNGIKDDLFQGNEDAYYLTENAFAFVASAMIPIGTASKAGELTFRSGTVMLGKEGVSTLAGYGASNLVYDKTNNQTLGMIAGILASTGSAKVLNMADAKLGWSNKGYINGDVLTDEAKEINDKFRGDNFDAKNSFESTFNDSDRREIIDRNASTTCGLNENLDGKLDGSKFSAIDKTSLLEAREKVPEIKPDTVMQKVIPSGQVDNYLNGEWTQVRNCCSKAEDTAPYISCGSDAYKELRLDYKGNDGEGCNVKELEQNADVYIIRFTSDANPSDIGIPNDGHPCTGTGFTGSDDHLIPEYKYPATTPTDGAIYKIDADGNETMVGMWDKDANRFYPVP